MTKQTFGAAISALRKEKGLTQLELARGRALEKVLRS